MEAFGVLSAKTTALLVFPLKINTVLEAPRLPVETREGPILPVLAPKPAAVSLWSRENLIDFSEAIARAQSSLYCRIGTLLTWRPGSCVSACLSHESVDALCSVNLSKNKCKRTISGEKTAFAASFPFFLEIVTLTFYLSIDFLFFLTEFLFPISFLNLMNFFPQEVVRESALFF